MAVETRIRIALGAVLVVLVAALVVFGVATRSVEEEPSPPPKPAQSGSSVEEEISKTQQKIKDTQREIEARAQGERLLNSRQRSKKPAKKRGST